MKVIIVGGSISGLMHGIMLKHHGHDVHILERTVRDLEARGAGVGTGEEIFAFLEAHDRVNAPFSLPSAGVHVIDRDSKVIQEMVIPMQMTTWDAMYYRLRANFDGCVSSYCSIPPPQLETDGQVIYDMVKEVTGIETGEISQSGSVTVRYTDKTTNETGKTLTADLVIGADGAASPVKAMIAPHAPAREYVGYVAWRGIVAETAVSAPCRSALAGWFTFHVTPNQYVVVYPIPGASGSIEPGSQALNFVWYSWQDAASLKEILTDSNGHTHRWTVPAGLLREEIWEKQKQVGQACFSKEFGEILSVTDKPFVQVISDCAAPSSPGPGFAGGRVLLVGDALTNLRPHSGFALNQTARHCLDLEKRLDEIEAEIRGSISANEASSEKRRTHSTNGIDKWNSGVLEFSRIAQLRAITIGMMYMKGKGRLLPDLLRWKFAEIWLEIKNGWRWLTNTQF